MAADHGTSLEQVEQQWREGFGNLAVLYKGNLDAMWATGQAAISGGQAISTELLAFLQSRMKGSLEFAQKLGSCTSPEAALEAQVEYLTGALKAYTDELATFGQLAGRLSSEALVPFAARPARGSGPAPRSAAA